MVPGILGHSATAIEPLARAPHLGNMKKPVFIQELPGRTLRGSAAEASR